MDESSGSTELWCIERQHLFDRKLICFLSCSWAAASGITHTGQSFIPALELHIMKQYNRTLYSTDWANPHIQRAQASNLFPLPGLDSGSFSSTFFPGANFSALSSKALRATLLKTFPWASLINWTSWRMSQYSPYLEARRKVWEKKDSCVFEEYS